MNQQSARRILLWIGAVLLLASLFEFAGSPRMRFTHDWPMDYDINVVAARRLVDREPLYDRAAARQDGIDFAGKNMALTGKSTFSSYIGDPVVALTHVPFLPFDHDAGAKVFRILSLLLMVGAILLVAWSLSPPARAPAALFSLSAFFFAFPMVKSISLGQGTGVMMFCLAVGLSGCARERWGLAGVGFGVAAALKVSPILIVVYLLVRGKTRAVKTAVLSAVVLLVTAAAIGRPGDLLVWIRDVSPSVSKGTISAYNQSIVGAMARLTASVPDFWTQRGSGAWYLLAYAAWGVTLLGLWRLRRGKPVEPLELGVIVLVLLLAGPLSWDHYYAWAFLPLVLVIDPVQWRGRGMWERCVLVGVLVVSTCLMRNGIPVPSVAVVRADWSQRLRTMTYVGAGVGYLVVAVWLLVRPAAREAVGPQWVDAGTAAVGDPREVVAAGVHQRG